MKFLTVAILITAIMAVQSKSTSEYESYKDQFNKKYNATENERRSQIFRKTHLAIINHNARFASGQETYTKGHNQFSDWSDDERKKILGYKPSAPRSLPVPLDESLLDRALPAYYDLRASKCLPPIKNQGKCGDCYVFAAVTPIEYQFCLKKNNNVSVSLSDQQATDCTYSASYDGCNGGWHEDVFAYVARAGGLATSAAYPFTSGISGRSGLCKSSITKVAQISKTYVALPSNEAVIQSALYNYGPITFAYAVTSNFQLYKSGIFSDKTCGSTMWDLNHEMVLVGYGTSNGVPYWIVRNSWGTSWGQAGYAFIKRGVNMCGLAVDIGYPTVI